MADPGTVLDRIAADASDLDRLSKAIFDATNDVDSAEANWEQAYDLVAEAMVEEYRDAGRKTDPAEHTIVSEARRKHREEWQALRRSKRRLERLQSQLQAKRSAISGRQSELGALRDEMRALTSVGQ